MSTINPLAAWSTLTLVSIACTAMIALSGRLWSRYTSDSRHGRSIYVAWVGEILALIGVVILPVLMTSLAPSLGDAGGILIAWLAIAGGLVWWSYQPDAGAWQPVMVGAATVFLGALVGFGVQCAVQEAWWGLAVFTGGALLAIVGLAVLVVQLNLSRGTSAGGGL